MAKIRRRCCHCNDGRKAADFPAADFPAVAAAVKIAVAAAAAASAADDDDGMRFPTFLFGGEEFG